MLAPKYSDGVSSPTASVTGSSLPNARLLSLSLYGESSLPDDYRTMAFLQWGQLVAHDMTHFLKSNTTGSYVFNIYSYVCLQLLYICINA